ncbi:hypothetical protein FA048_12600 [Pedobacter polaris]|uniref:Bacteriocin n=1 Tax=Pedobacter polaris TaxID=2571273 RepID=A0A4U1CN47_9SPHI|nr:hypothetical protein [Pedobacter polaris]TKC07998.1 hypothetical protein FA048_12600 [Pedobacter polaris]
MLSKAEMKKVMGGEVPGGGGTGVCVAMCGEKSVTCQGTCTATDGVGCTGTDSLNETYTKSCSANQIE